MKNKEDIKQFVLALAQAAFDKKGRDIKNSRFRRYFYVR